MTLIKASLILCGILFIPTYFFIKEYLKLKKEYKEADELQKVIYKFIIIILLIPFVIFIFDRYDIFNLLKITENLTINYDWLSFLGTYIGTIISAIFLIIVTRLDRDDNFDSMRESQRPNLCTRVYLPNNFRITDTSIEGYIYKTNGSKNTSDDYIIKITNSGQTVAVIDTENSYFIATKIKKQENNEPIVEINKISFNKYEDRLHINSNEEANIVILSKDIKEIQKVYIEYIDLFNKRYKDEIEVKEGKSKVACNNELITI